MTRNRTISFTSVFAILAIAFGVSGCGGAVLSSTKLTTKTDEPVFLDYGLPRAKLYVTVKVDKDGAVSVSIPEKVAYFRDPGPEHNFRLVQHHEWYTSDELTVQTDGAGLLSAINAKSENQSVAILNQALALSTQLAGVLATLEVSCKPSISLSYTLDPFVKGDGDEGLDKLNTRLKAGGFCIKLKLRPLETVSDALPPTGTPTQEARGEGVYYRVLRSYALDVVSLANQDEPLASLTYSIPDATRTYFMPLKRKWFVKFDVELTFDRGVLTKFKSTNPSQALAALQLPVDVIKNILGLNTALSGSAVSKK